MQLPFSAACALICPICGANLTRMDAVLRCIAGHSFDIARTGYVNLLLTQSRGDTKPMLVARRQFLDSGHYAPLSTAINDLVAASVQQHAALGHSICYTLDAGCGEGYYLSRLSQHLVAHFSAQCAFYGMDVSKHAITMAAKRCHDICWFVADLNQKVCVPDRSVQVLLNIFAPRNAREFARISAPGGLLLIVIPSPQHLQEVRDRFGLLTIEPRKQQRIEEQFVQTFKLAHTQAVEYTLRLNTTALTQVIMMTPNYWHASGAVYKLAEQLHSLETHAAFTLLLFRRR